MRAAGSGTASLSSPTIPPSAAWTDSSASPAGGLCGSHRARMAIRQASRSGGWKRTSSDTACGELYPPKTASARTGASSFGPKPAPSAAAACWRRSGSESSSRSDSSRKLRWHGISPIASTARCRLRAQGSLSSRSRAGSAGSPNDAAVSPKTAGICSQVATSASRARGSRSSAQARQTVRWAQASPDCRPLPRPAA